MHYEKFQDGTVKCIEDEIPFEVPEGWAWSRLVSLTAIITKGASPKWQGVDYTSSGTMFITSENVEVETLLLESPKFLPEKINKIQPRSILETHDILTNIVGASIGRTCEYTLVDSANTNQAVAIIRLIAVDMVSYVVKCLNSDYCVNLMFANQVNVARANLSLSSLANFLIPIPPLKEMYRIIAHLDCSLRHISGIQSSEDELRQLILFTKTKILDLAIRGQLVPQNPDDEPASVLLERIRAEKEELIKQGKIKLDKKESVIFKGDDNSYYQQTGDLIESISTWELEELPDNWVLCCLGELCDYGNCNNVDADSIAGNAWILDLEDIEKNTGKVLRKIRKNERDFTSTKHSFYKGQVLYSKLRPYLNKVIIADEDGFCTSEILPLEFANVVLPQYALYYLMSPTFLRYAKQCSYGVKMPRLGTADGRKAIFPLPPIKEQYRIANSISKCFTQIDNILSALL